MLLSATMDKILYHPTPGTTGFFLVRNVPELLDTSNFEGGGSPLESYYERYDLEIKTYKEEAIKNGEITNPELAIKGGTHGILFTLGNKQILSGDLFDLPEGLEFEIKWMVLASTSPNSKYVECKEQYAKENPGFSPKTVIRLVPSKKEAMPDQNDFKTEEEFFKACKIQRSSKPETQEELFRQVVEVFNKEHLKYGRPDYTILKQDFTITRNSK